MNNRMQRAKINAFSTVLSQLVTMGIGIVIPWLMIENFGSEAYGATTSISQFLAYIALFEGGIGRVARGTLYGPLASGDEAEISRIYLAVKRFFSIIGVAFVGYTLILAVFYYDIADVTVFDRGYVFMLVVVIALSKFAEYMWGISNITLFNADRRQYVVNSVTIISNILNVVAIALLVSFGADILWVKFASSLVFILKPVIFTIYLKTHYRIQKSTTRAVLENKATGIAQHMAYVIQSNTDVLVLTIFADLKLVAVYSVYHLISFSLRNIVTSFSGGMEAVFGNLIANGEKDELIRTYRKYKFILTLLSLTLFGAAGALIIPFVKLYTHGTTDVNYVQPVFAILLILSEAINCITWPCFNLTIAANKLKESRVGAYSEAAINLILSCILVFWNPLVGIVIGTLASTLFKAVYYMVFSAKHVLSVKPTRPLLECLVSFIFLVLTTVFGLLITESIPLYNYKRWIFCAFVTVIVVGAFALVVSIMLYPKVVKRYAKSLSYSIKHLFIQRLSKR